MQLVLQWACAQESELQAGPSASELKSEALKDLALLQKPARERSIFRRKGAKAPNPLAVRKKQKGQQMRLAAGDASQHRKRRKGRKGSAQQDSPANAQAG